MIDLLSIPNTTQVVLKIQGMIYRTISCRSISVIPDFGKGIRANRIIILGIAGSLVRSRSKVHIKAVGTRRRRILV